MNREKEKIMNQINNFRESLDYFKNVGLNKPIETQVNFSDSFKEEAAKANVLKKKTKNIE